MNNDLELVLYTRPTCSDCQDAKAYLASKGIPYEHKDVSADTGLEEDMKKLAGNRVVPLLAFYKKGLFGKRKLVRHYTGFEMNKEEIDSLLGLR
ncbi:glutaredoxin family protein [Planococcus sp. FY231025]|uniref:glutaredoxin family protein n=1 Tax=Planococcus sp. FY231025 TaxID=3455699 RepID=UPI003F93D979